ncbi:hypothetical protein ACFE04_007345 [Oxalis oulophora]
MRGRVYLPQDELAQFGLSDKDIFARKVTDKWREFMKEQITRATFYFNLAEEGASQLDKASRWPVWSSLILYREILDAIEENDYDNLTKRAYVGRTKKLLMLPEAFGRAQSSPLFWRAIAKDFDAKSRFDKTVLSLYLPGGEIMISNNLAKISSQMVD